MTAANRARGASRSAAVLGITLAAGLVLAATAAEPPPIISRLESPMADAAVIELPPDAPAETTPMLLVLDAERIAPSMARLSILRRGGAWDRVEVLDVDLERDDLDARWLVGLGGGRYSLIATSRATGAGTDHASVVGLEVRHDSGSHALVETGRSRIDGAVSYSGPADVDGLGTPELVLGLEPLHDVSEPCGISSLLVLDAASSMVRRVIDVPGHLGSGVIGRWDGAPGDDLLVHASAGCPDPETTARLVSIRLRDGTETTMVPTLRARVSDVPPPLRVRLSDDRPDAAFANLGDTLGLIDTRGPVTVATAPGQALVAGPDIAADGPAVRISWLDRDGVHTAHVRDTPRDLLQVTDRRELGADVVGSERWGMVVAAVATDARLHGLPSAWLGAVATEGCPDLVLPGAIESCGSGELRPGATWLATRIATVLPIEGRATTLIAAGIGWDPLAGLPPSPTPSMAGPPGWWRHGASTGFVLSEVRGSDVVYFRDFPSPKATIEATTDKDGSATLPGYTGTRLFVSIRPLGEDEEGPDVAPSKLDSLLQVPNDTVVRTVRVPVPPGNESGRDGAFTMLGLSDIRKDGAPSTSRWSLRVVPINDWGEVGFPVVRTITRDAVGPTLNLETPFTNPVWPFLAHLSGRAEPGSAVTLDGSGPLEVDEAGRFTVVTRLAPWPQTVRLTATDVSGNTSVGEFSVVGGVDYRQFPWALIVALTLLGLVAVRGLSSAGRARGGGVEATSWSLGVLDDAARPEIEELPPGSGLAPR